VEVSKAMRVVSLCSACSLSFEGHACELSFICANFEKAFRDRTAGSAANRGKPTDENTRDDRQSRRGGGRGRGDRQFDRHSRTVGG